MQWLELGQLSDAHPAAFHSPPQQNREKNKLKRIVGEGKDRESTYQ